MDLSAFMTSSIGILSVGTYTHRFTYAAHTHECTYILEALQGSASSHQAVTRLLHTEVEEGQDSVALSALYHTT